ncbi:MAG: type II toxin-antitoxin system VapB family antitoxin [Myxococcota bacterium]
MKTTIEIADALLGEAKKVAAREHTTVRSLVEEGLRRALDERKRQTKSFKLKLVTVRGKGLRPGVGWDLPRDIAYDLPSDG